MAYGFVTAVRNDRGDVLTAARDAAVGAAKLRAYDGTQPANPGDALSGNTLLFEVTFSVTSAPAASGGVVTANAITDDSSADNSSTATFFRELDGDDVVVADAPIADLNLNTNVIAAGVNVSITGHVTTEGNS